MRLISYEIKKLFNNKTILYTMCICLLVNAVLCYTLPSDSSNDIPSQDAIFLITLYYEQPEKIEKEYRELQEWSEYQEQEWHKAMDRGDYSWIGEAPPSKYASDGYNDLQYLDWLFKWLNRRDDYNKKIVTIKEQAEKNKKDLEAKGIDKNSFAWKYQDKVEKTYHNVSKKITFSDEYMRGWDLYCSYRPIIVFIIIMTILVSVVSFTQEKNSHMINLIYPTKKGRYTFIFTKCIALICSIGVVNLFFTLETIFIIGLKYGYSSIDVLIQEVASMVYCPVAVPIWCYITFVFLIRWLVFSVLAMIILLISLRVHNTIFLTLISSLLLGINVLMYFFPYVQVDNILYYINIVSCSLGYPIFERYRAVNICNSVIDMMFIILLLYLLCLLLCSGLTVILYDTRIHFQLREKTRHSLNDISRILHFNSLRCFLFNSKNKTYSMHLVNAEMSKCQTAVHMVWLVICFLIIEIFIGINNYSGDFSYEESVYYEYMSVLEGPWTENKNEYIIHEREQIDHIINSYTDYQQRYADGTLSYIKYRNYMIEYDKAEIRDSLFTKIEDHNKYILNCAASGKEAWFVYDTGWKRFLFMDFDWGMLGVLITVIAGIFTYEYKRTTSANAFIYIMRSTKNGYRDTFYAKYVTATIVAIIVFFLFSSINILFILIQNHLPAGNAPLYSIQRFRDFTFNITIWQYCVLHLAIKLFATVLYVWFVLSLSVLLRKSLPTVMTSIVIILLPRLLDSLQITFLNNYDMTLFMRGTPFLLQNNWYILIIAETITCILFIEIAKRRWEN